jgi:hypothetical protein
VEDKLKIIYRVNSGEARVSFHTVWNSRRKNRWMGKRRKKLHLFVDTVEENTEL